MVSFLLSTAGEALYSSVRLSLMLDICSASSGDFFSRVSIVLIRVGACPYATYPRGRGDGPLSLWHPLGLLGTHENEQYPTSRGVALWHIAAERCAALCPELAKADIHLTGTVRGRVSLIEMEPPCGERDTMGGGVRGPPSRISDHTNCFFGTARSTNAPGGVLRRLRLPRSLLR